MSNCLSLQWDAADRNTKALPLKNMLCKEQSWEILYKPPSSFSAPLKQLTEYPPELMLTSIYFFSYRFLNVSRSLALCWEKIPHSLQNVYVHSSDSYFIQIVLFSPLYLTLTWVMKYNFFYPCLLVKYQEENGTLCYYLPLAQISSCGLVICPRG